MGWRGGRQYVSILVVNALAVLVVVDVPQSMGYRTALDERTSLDVLFEEHVKRYLPSYTLNQTEMAFRRQVFAKNILRYQDRQANYTTWAFGHTAKFGPDKFSDWTDDEFQLLLGTRSYSYPGTYQSHDASSCSNSPVTCSISTTGSIPENFDWRKDSRPVITGVKNQGKVQESAFSTAQTVEAASSIAGHKVGPELSVQQMISCDTKSHGCAGGIISGAFQYVYSLSQQGKGLETANAFPFQCESGCARGSPSCPKISSPFARINSTCSCIDMSEKAMQYFVAQYGPLSIKVDATPWNGYHSGIMRFHCPSLQSLGNVRVAAGLLCCSS
eukprot:gene10867-2942_t